MFHELSEQTKSEILWKLTAMDVIISNLEKQGFDFFPSRQRIINEDNKVIFKNKENVLVEFDFNNGKILLNSNRENNAFHDNYNYYNKLNQNENLNKYEETLNQKEETLNQNEETLNQNEETLNQSYY